MDLQVFSSIGFGFCPPSTVETSDDGGALLIYRYVPAQLVDNEEARIMGAFNQAAQLGALDEIGADRIDLGEIEESDSLTDEGLRLFHSMPTYARLRIEEDYIEWQAWWEDKPVVTLRAEQLEPLIEEALKLPPQQLWAQKHLASVAHYLYGANDPDAAAMPLAPGLQGDIEHSDDLPRAAVEERVEYPWGLWKVVLIAIGDDRSEEFEAWDQTDVFQVIVGSVAILKENAFTYKPVPFIRWELPATLVPNVVRWAEKERVRRGDPWAPIAVMPYFDWQSPIASIPLEPEEEAGMAAAYTVPVAQADLDDEFRDWMESEIRKQIS